MNWSDIERLRIEPCKIERRVIGFVYCGVMRKNSGGLLAMLISLRWVSGLRSAEFGEYLACWFGG